MKRTKKRNVTSTCPSRWSLTAWTFLFLLLNGTFLPANPTGGTVAAGSAAIANAGTTTTITQSTQAAIINWQQFSIASNEAAKFFVPSMSSVTLNRVTGGNPSAIYGSLTSNGRIILINPSGIVVGPSGRIDAASFIGSTLDISNDQFLRGGNLNFLGNGGAIDNEGTIHASDGDVYLIAAQVTNGGKISAPHGTAGLAAGTDVLYQRAGDQHLFVQSTPLNSTRAQGVSNSGTIRAATAELKAAGDNVYALAINNTGQIAATGFKKINGQVYLVAEGGTINNGGVITASNPGGAGGTIVLNGSGPGLTGNTVANSGTLNASSTQAGEKGGTITLKNSSGGTIQSGQLIAKGGQGSAGGSAEVSGQTLQFTGTVDLTAPGGSTGSLLLDPATLEVVSGGTGSISNGENNGASTIDPTTVETALGTANLTLNADTNITINNAIIWTTTNALTLSTNNSGSTIDINAPISGLQGSLVLDTAAETDPITTGSGGAVSVASFILQSGSWLQNTATLPSFVASHDFELQNTSTFVRVAGGNGTTNQPYEIADVYGLQGLGSPSGDLLTASAELVNNISAAATQTWNNGAGFVPIGRGDGAASYSGTFNGQQYTINGLYIDIPGSGDTGLFGIASGTIENVNLTNIQVTGGAYTGGLVGSLGNDYNATSGIGTISDSSSTGTVNGGTYVGGVVGLDHGTSITQSSSSGTVNGGGFVGGLVGSGLSPIDDSYSTAQVTASGGPVGGLEGENYNGGIVHDTYSTGVVSGNSEVGGLVGRNLGTINDSFWDTVTSGITSLTGGIGSGTNSGVTPATTAELYSQSYILANSPVTPTWDFTNVWTTDGGTTAPQLLALSHNNVFSGGTGGGPGNNNTSSNGSGGIHLFGGNDLPPQLTPPNQDTNPTLIFQSDLGLLVPNTVLQPFSVSSAGNFSLAAAQSGDLAFASGSDGQVAAGDAAQLNGGALNNVSSPEASHALDSALSPEVFDSLQQALGSAGDFADADDETSDDTANSVTNRDATQIIGEDDVVEIGGGDVKKIPLSSAPKPLRDAMNSGVMRGLQPAEH